MTREDIVNSARVLATQIAKSGPKSTWTHDYAMTRIMELVDAAAAQERDVCVKQYLRIMTNAVNDAVDIECEACAKMVDHILKEGGGTWGDAIRARGKA